MENVVVLRAPHSVVPVFLDFLKVFNVEGCEQAFDWGAGEMARRPDRCPVVPITEELTGEAATGPERLDDPVPEGWKM